MLGTQPALPEAARFAGNAVLVADGSTALVPAAALAGATDARLWLRNGLGQTTAATPTPVDATLAAAGLVRLRLLVPMPVGASRQAAGRAPFAGSAGYAIEFGASDMPAWPLLSQGFLGNPIGDTGVRKLGFAATAGAAVLDAGGALVGIALEPVDGQSTWLPTAATLPSWPTPAPSSPGVAARPGLALVAPDAIYESGLRRGLQLLVDRRAATSAGR